VTQRKATKKKNRNWESEKRGAKMNAGSMPGPFFDQNMSAFHTRAGVAAAVIPQNNV
jgi:hypothetical protein